jgi:hypothetical protein
MVGFLRFAGSGGDQAELLLSLSEFFVCELLQELIPVILLSYWIKKLEVF